MPKQKRSNPSSSSSPKKVKVQAKARPESPPPRPGPSRFVDQVDLPDPMQVVEPEDSEMTEGVTVATTSGGPTTTNPRVFPPELLSNIERGLRDLKNAKSLMASVEENEPWILQYIRITIKGGLSEFQGSKSTIPTGVVSEEELLENIKGKKGSEILGLVKKALKEDNWNDVLSHGIHLALPMNKLIDYVFSKMYFGPSHMSNPTVRTCFCSLPTKRSIIMSCRSASAAFYADPIWFSRERQVQAPRRGDIPNVTLVTQPLSLAGFRTSLVMPS
jgi:hypothetical protein